MMNILILTLLIFCILLLGLILFLDSYVNLKTKAAVVVFFTTIGVATLSKWIAEIIINL